MARVPSAGFPGSGKRKVFGSGPVSRFFTTMRAFLTGLAVLFIAALAAGAFLAWRWVETWTATASPLAPSGGLYFPGTVLNDVPHFAQADPRWTTNLLGPTPGTLGAEGCAVASAAMVLAGYGAKVDPGSLNKFLQGNGGYTGNGWLYWEKAAEVPPGLAEHIYEADASHFLIDWNLLRGNPVIVRLRYPGASLISSSSSVNKAANISSAIPAAVTKTACIFSPSSAVRSKRCAFSGEMPRPP